MLEYEQNTTQILSGDGPIGWQEIQTQDNSRTAKQDARSKKKLSQYGAHKKWKQKNREKCNAYDREYRKRNKERDLEKKREYYRKYRKSHRESISRDNKKWEVNNKDKKKEYFRHRSKNDLGFLLRGRLRSRIYSAIRMKNAKKCMKTASLVGCTIQFLIKYLESKFTDGMSWLNNGRWHIDHKIPCASFNLIDPEQQKKCFHYTNLQPLWAIDNFKKSDKIL